VDFLNFYFKGTASKFSTVIEKFVEKCPIFYFETFSHISTIHTLIFFLLEVYHHFKQNEFGKFIFSFFSPNPGLGSRFWWIKKSVAGSGFQKHFLPDNPLQKQYRIDCEHRCMSVWLFLDVL